MTAAPRLAFALLRLGLPARDRDVIEGDLREEFDAYVRAERNARAARRWLWSQVSATVVLSARARLARAFRPESLAAAIAASIAPAGALLVLDALWSFVLSTVPLKDGAVRSGATLLALLAAACGAAWLARASAATRPRLAWVAAAAATGAALFVMTGITAWWFKGLCIAAVVLPWGIPRRRRTTAPPGAAP